MNRWDENLARYPLAAGELPGTLGQLVAHVAPLATAVPDDWPALLGLTLFSSLWPGVTVDGHTLALWFVGAATGPQVQMIGDELLAATPVKEASITGGVGELVAARSGQVLSYYAPATSLARELRDDPGRKQTLATLAAGRPPYTERGALVATLGLTDWTGVSVREDWVSGWLGHCLLCAPDTRRRLPDRYPTAEERATVREALTERIAALAAVRRVEVGRSRRLDAHAKLIGADTDRPVALDAPPLEEPDPALLIVRIRTVAALLALAHGRPQGDCIAATDQDIDLSIRLVERAHAYGRRVADYLGKTTNDTVMEKVLSYLEEHDESNPRHICMNRRLKAKDVYKALDLLHQEGRVTARTEGKLLLYRLVRK